jgi:hypothetical protein
MRERRARSLGRPRLTGKVPPITPKLEPQALLDGHPGQSGARDVVRRMPVHIGERFLRKMTVSMSAERRGVGSGAG